MADIQSESRFFWRFVFHILITPFNLILVLLGKKRVVDLFRPFYDLIKFIFEPKFTIFIAITNLVVSFLGFFYFNDATFNLLMKYPSDILSFRRFYSIITNGFIHANITHLVGNLIGILIFGRIVERKLGMFKTAFVYFSALVISGVGDSVINLFVLGNNIPGLGASGALMGLVATAMLIDPFYVTYGLFVPLPVMVVGWLAIYSDISGILSPNLSGIGYFAHLFGYFSITITMFLIGTKERQKLKRGLIINLISLVIAYGLYVLVRANYLPSF